MRTDELPVTFGVDNETLLGVLSPSVEPSETGFLVVVGGPQYRAGSHRQFVTLSRRLAAAGHPSLRFDMRGMGDSDGDLRSFEDLSDDIAAAQDALVRSAGVRRVVLFGLCDGASAILIHLARRAPDPRAAGVVLLNPWVRSEASLARTHVKHYYLQRVLQPDFWRKLLSGRMAASAVSGLLCNLRSARSGSSSGSETSFQQLMAQGWERFDGPTLLLLSGQDLTAREFVEYSQSDKAWQRALQKRPPHRVDLPEADHTCSDGDARERLITEILSWMRQFGSPSALPGLAQCLPAPT